MSVAGFIEYCGMLHSPLINDPGHINHTSNAGIITFREGGETYHII